LGRRRRFGDCELTLLWLLAAAAAQPTEPSLAGSWTNESGSVTVLIAPCGEDSWCGTVQSASAKAQADAARGGTPGLVGTQLLRNFRAAGPHRWKGVLFVPDLNQRSKAELIELGPDRIMVRGCAIGGLLCKSQVWHRTDAS
jgi:uncharacterized protein (DUF2147 family)